MINKIKVTESRRLFPVSEKLGTIGENNAEILKFEFPTDINGEAISLFTAQAVFNNTYNGTVQSYVVTIPANNEIKLTAELTTSSELTLMVQFLKGTEVKWKSCPIDLYLANSADGSNVNPFLAYQSQWEEEAATDLAAALTNSATESALSPMPAYDEMDLDELIDEVEDTLMLTDEKKHLVDCEQSVINYVESLTNLGTNNKPWHAGDSNHLLSFPYFDTKNVKSANPIQGQSFGSYVKEIGFNFSNVPSILWGANYLGASSSRMEKLTLITSKTVDGVTTVVSTPNNLLNNFTALRYFYCDVIKSTSFLACFNGCTLLTKVCGFNPITKKIDDNYGLIDFTGCTNTTNMFKNCNSLEEVRFKPCTSLNDGLTLSLDLSSCGVISKESICSLINALQYYTPGTVKSIKVAYPTIYNHMTTDWFCKVIDELMHVEICESTDEGAITFEQAIGNLNWTVTH